MDEILKRLVELVKTCELKLGELKAGCEKAAQKAIYHEERANAFNEKLVELSDRETAVKGLEDVQSYSNAADLRFQAAEKKENENEQKAQTLLDIRAIFDKAKAQLALDQEDLKIKQEELRRDMVAFKKQQDTDAKKSALISELLEKM